MSAINPSASEAVSSLFALPLTGLDAQQQQGDLSMKDKSTRKKHNWKQMEHTEELKTCMFVCD